MEAFPLDRENMSVMTTDHRVRKREIARKVQTNAQTLLVKRVVAKRV